MQDSLACDAKEHAKLKKSMNQKEYQTINKTPNSECPDCLEKKRHKPENWKKYHPLAGHGHDNMNKSIKKEK